MGKTVDYVKVMHKLYKALVSDNQWILYLKLIFGTLKILGFSRASLVQTDTNLYFIYTMYQWLPPHRTLKEQNC